MKDVFIKGFVDGFEKTAAEEEEEAGSIFEKILNKVSDKGEDKGGAKEEPAKEEPAKEEPAKEEPAKGEEKTASVGSDFDRIIQKLGLGAEPEKTASAKAPEGNLPSWMAKVAKKVDDEEEEEEEEEDKGKKKGKDEDEDKGEGKGGMKALFAKMKKD